MFVRRGNSVVSGLRSRVTLGLKTKRQLTMNSNPDDNELFHRYLRLLHAMVYKFMSQQLKNQIEPDEMVQSILGSIIRISQESNRPLLESEEYFGLVRVIAERKIRKKYRYHRRKKRDMNLLTQVSDEMPSLEEIVADVPDPTVDDGAQVERQVRDFLATLDLRDRQILEERIRGQPLAEIAKSQRCTIRTISRKLQQIRESFQSFVNDDE
jgi:eukaryotic-like serine/threonine-protein kinase